MNQADISYLVLAHRQIQLSSLPGTNPSRGCSKFRDLYLSNDITCSCKPAEQRLLIGSLNLAALNF